MEDYDINIVDDDEPIPSTSHNSVESHAFYARPRLSGDTMATRSTRLRNTPPIGMRSSGSKPKGAPKVKLKLSEKAKAAMASGTSFLGPYDRELDSDDEDLAFEEQFILRVPPGEDCEKLRKAVVARDIGNDVWFKFKGSSDLLASRPSSVLIPGVKTLAERFSTWETIYTHRN